MRFTRKNYLRFMEAIEKDYASHINYDHSIATPKLGKPTPSFDGAITVEGTDYRAYFDCVLSDYEYEGVAWMTYITLYNEDMRYHRAWKVNCCSMERFKVLLNSVCGCEKFGQVVALLEGSDCCES